MPGDPPKQRSVIPSGDPSNASAPPVRGYLRFGPVPRNPFFRQTPSFFPNSGFSLKNKGLLALSCGNRPDFGIKLPTESGKFLRFGRKLRKYPQTRAGISRDSGLQRAGLTGFRDGLRESRPLLVVFAPSTVEQAPSNAAPGSRGASRLRRDSGAPYPCGPQALSRAAAHRRHFARSARSPSTMARKIRGRIWNPFTSIT